MQPPPSHNGSSEDVNQETQSVSFSTYTTLSQDEILRLVSIHVHQELSRYPSIFDDEEDNAHQHKRLKRIKAKIGHFSSRFDGYPPFCYIVSFQKWIEKLSEKSKVVEVLASAGYFSVLYPFIIAGIIMGNVAKDKTIIVFIFNILAIIPISVVISFLTETLAELTNPTIGSLLNITFGNAIELIFSIIALFKGQLDTVQGSMVGSWLATTQLILGCALFFAAFNKRQLSLNRLNCYFNVIFMVFSGFVFKLVYSLNYDSSYTSAFKGSSSSEPSQAIINLSTGLSVLHLLLYVVYLIIPYQHRKVLGITAKDEEKNVLEHGTSVRFSETNRMEVTSVDSSISESNTAVGNRSSKTGFSEATLAPMPEPIEVEASKDEMSESTKKASNRFSVFVYAFFLLGVTVVASFNSDYLLDSLNDFSEETHIPKAFITVILIPIFSNAAEHVTSIVVAYKGHLELALNVAVGSAIQINFFIVPFLVLIAHATSAPYTFLYENVYCEAMFAAAILASFSIVNGKAYLATGSILIVSYVVCGVVVYFMGN